MASDPSPQDRPGLRPPVDVALSAAAGTIPGPDELAGGTAYEPKWDGFRAVLFAAEPARPASTGHATAAGGAASVTTPFIQSRHHKDLSGFFPEILTAAADQLPAGTVIDGELVSWDEDRLRFDILQRRLTPSPREVPRLAADHPASFLAFDVLAVGHRDVRRLPYAQRRELLEALPLGPPLQVTPATRDLHIATDWFIDFPVAGVEGLVAKGVESRYRGGRCDWVTIRSRDTVDAIVGAVLGTFAVPRVLVLGLPDRSGRLRIVGRTVPLAPRQRELVKRRLSLARDAEKHPWPTTVDPTLLGEPPRGHREPVHLTRVTPDLVVEVEVDTAFEHGRYRHPARFVRTRLELTPDDVDPHTSRTTH